MHKSTWVHCLLAFGGLRSVHRPRWRKVQRLEVLVGYSTEKLPFCDWGDAAFLGYGPLPLMSRPNFGPLTWLISGSPTLDSVSFPSLHMEQTYVWMAACGCHKKQSWKQWRGMVRIVHYCLQFSKSGLCWRSSCQVMISFCIQRGSARMVEQICIKQSDLLAVWGWWVLSFHHSYIWTCGHMESISTLGTSIIWLQQW